MKATLLKLHKFLSDHKIMYMVTGTTALDLLGVLPNYAPRDIDIKVYGLTAEQAEKLQEQESLSGLQSEDYDHGTKCYTFIVNGVKINAIVVKTTTPIHDILGAGIPLQAMDPDGSRSVIYVQRVFDALYDKMRLNRKKDKDYMLNLITKISRL